ncbi:MAG: multidrug efflux SMR transporter [Trueperaceae bacterium]|nr:multidrug efflux SMR transporter [Trueperaceae bacterium]
MSWTYLFAATLFDVIATVYMKQSDGFSKLFPTFIAITTFGASIFLLALALQKLEVIPVYVVWVGFGTALITILGILIYQEAISPLKLISVAFIVAGVIGVSLSSNALN